VQLRHLLFLVLLAESLVARAGAHSVIHCPLRDERYSIDSPLIDVLLKPEAKAAIGRTEPALLESMPSMFANTTPPSFSAIITLRTLASFKHIPETTLDPVDEALKSLPVTDSDRQARCARYDIENPRIDMPKGHPRLLLFQKINGFRDGPSVEAAQRAFEALAQRNGWGLVVTDKGGTISPHLLKKIDVIVWNNVSGDVLTITQRGALKSYLEHGGGFVAVHGSGGDPVYFWDWYADVLIGARFLGHPMTPQFQDAGIVVEDSGPIGRALQPGWTMKDEWYSFIASARISGTHVIATLDESTYSPTGLGGRDLRMGDHPIAWQKCISDGRSFYSAIGHRPESYSDPHYVTLLQNAVRWAANLSDTTCKDGREVPRQ